MTKLNNVCNSLLIFLFAFCALGASTVAPSTPAEKLEKGIELYENHQDEEALDYFVDVMMNGTREEVNTANKYLNLMHERLGGIQQPQEVSVRNDQEGMASAGEQEEEGPWYAQESEHQILNEWVQNQRVAGEEDVVASGWVEEGAFETEDFGDEDFIGDDLVAEGTEEVYSSFEDLSSPEAIEAREAYVQQKMDSMWGSAIDRLREAKGVHFYMRDGLPDALDIDPEIIFDGNKFRPEAQPLLNDIYELLVLTQDASYVILPPGSYTDDVTLPRMRQAMALNSYLISRGISQGKVHYNMGLVNEEPPARYANLNGLSIVFDYDRALPTVLQKNEKNETTPLLSMAIVPPCRAIDRSLGEAFVIDFSVLETVNSLNNWILQVVQHGRDGKFYVVRQLEGFGPVYHQFLWNGRKGIIGPDLPCGKYTLVLTGIDSMGKEQTLRRRLVVKCSSQQQQEISCAQACADCESNCLAAGGMVKTAELNYKSRRLWSKPKRRMGGAVASVKEDVVEETTSVANDSSVSTSTRTVKNTTIIQEYDDNDPLAVGNTTTTTTVNYPPANGEILPTDNPYDMPYEDYN